MTFMVLEVFLLVVALTITFKAYTSNASSNRPSTLRQPTPRAGTNWAKPAKAGRSQ